jgi:hypothetical protein
MAQHTWSLIVVSASITVAFLLLFTYNTSPSLNAATDLLSKKSPKVANSAKPAPTNQRSELALYLREQLDDQVKKQETHLFKSTLKREGIASALKNEGFKLPALSSAKQTTVTKATPQVHHRSKSATTMPKHNTQAKQHSKPAKKMPYDVKLAESILDGKPLSKSKMIKKALSKPAPKSKLVLKAVLEAQRSPEGQHRAKADAFLSKNVAEADAITTLARRQKSAATSPADIPPIPALAQAAALMSQLTGSFGGPAPAPRRARAARLDGAHTSVEEALRARLNAAVRTRERSQLVRDLARRAAAVVAAQAATHDPASRVARRAAIAPRGGGGGGGGGGGDGLAALGSRAPTQMQMESVLKKQLDAATQAR